MEDKRIELEQMKRVCFVNSDDGDRHVVWDGVPQNRRCVLLKDELSGDCHNLHQASPVRSTDVEDTPPFNYSAPYSVPVPHPVASSSTPPMLNAMKPQTDKDCQFALKVLHETFPVAYHPPLTKPPASVFCFHRQPFYWWFYHRCVSGGTCWF